MSVRINTRRALVAGALAATALIGSAASASADTAQGRVCSSGTSGSVCTQVTLTTGNLRYGYAAADTRGTTHTICLLGVALYYGVSPTDPGIDVADNNSGQCVTGSYFNMGTASASADCSGGGPQYYYSAVRYTVDGGPAERFQSDPVKVC